MSSTTTNYTGQKVDLCLFPGIAINTPVSLALGSTPQVIAGPAVAAQNFVRILLTPLGHYASDPELGSLLVAQLASGQLYYPSDIVQAFAIESHRCIQWMLRNSVGQPDDERVRSVTLLDYSVADLEINLTVELETVAGSTLSFPLPVTWANL